MSRARCHNVRCHTICRRSVLSFAAGAAMLVDSTFHRSMVAMATVPNVVLRHNEKLNEEVGN